MEARNKMLDDMNSIKKKKKFLEKELEKLQDFGALVDKQVEEERPSLSDVADVDMGSDIPVTEKKTKEKLFKK
jgi:hypothetical protein